MADEKQYAEPSKNPADQRTLVGTMNTMLRKFLQNVDDMLPATVIAYDRVSNVATVKPQIMVTTTDGQKISRPQYAKVPVFAFGGGGIGMNFPLQAGDSGWIKANDRDISLYQEQGSEQHPNTKRFHSFKDGMFFPDVLRKLIIDGEDEDAGVWQLYANTTKIAVHRNGDIVIRAGTSKITMTADGTVTVDYDTATFNGNTTTFNSDVIINGNTDMNGGYVKSNGVPIDDTHTHGGVQTGGGDTDAPNP